MKTGLVIKYQKTDNHKTFKQGSILYLYKDIQYPLFKKKKKAPRSLPAISWPWSTSCHGSGPCRGSWWGSSCPEHPRWWAWICGRPPRRSAGQRGSPRTHVPSGHRRRFLSGSEKGVHVSEKAHLRIRGQHLGQNQFIRCQYNKSVASSAKQQCCNDISSFKQRIFHSTILVWKTGLLMQTCLIPLQLLICLSCEGTSADLYWY